MKIRIHDQTRSRTLYKLIYRGIFYPAFFLYACERSFETASFCLKFWLFSSCRPWKLILSIFSKSKRPFEKQITPRLITYLYLSMDKIWAKMIFWLWPRNFDFARFLQTFALKVHLTPNFFIRLNECACFLEYICEKIFGFGQILDFLWPVELEDNLVQYRATRDLERVPGLSRDMT